MSTFKGFVKEIPFISVDFFDFNRTPTPKMFFLTHCHKDHITGLDYYSFREKLLRRDVYIYASPITANVIKRDFPDIKSNLKEIEIDKCKIISYEDDENRERHLQVTAVPAGHCPGSVMYFFENERNILCTGDFRIDPSELSKFKIFHMTSGQPKKIDVIYLDSTFFSEKYLHFPSRQESYDALFSTVKDWLNQSDNNKVYLRLSAKYSPEFLLINLARDLKEKIHVHYSKTLYDSIPDLDGLVSSNNEYDYRIHSGGTIGTKFTCCSIKIAPNVLILNLSALTWENFLPNGNPKQQRCDRNFRICVSFHASCTEIKEFLGYLKPKRVELCVLPETDDEKMVMYNLLEATMKEIKNESQQDAQSTNLKYKNCDSIELKESSSSAWSPLKKKRIRDDLLSSPPRNNKKHLKY